MMQVYKAKDGWRWRAVANNGRIVADSGQAYTTKASALKGIRALWKVLGSEVSGEPLGRSHR